MLSSPDDGRPNPVKGWQGDAIDIEIERCTIVPATYLWRVFDRDREIGVGVTRTMVGAHITSCIRRALYRWTARI